VQPSSVRIVHREEVSRNLIEWGSGRMRSEDLLQWADALYPSDSVEYSDWEGDNSVTKETLAVLESLDMNLALPEDSPIYLEFLSTPPGEFDAGYARFQDRLTAIDYESRRSQLRNVPLYSRFLQT